MPQTGAKVTVSCPKISLQVVLKMFIYTIWVLTKKEVEKKKPNNSSIFNVVESLKQN